MIWEAADSVLTVSCSDYSRSVNLEVRVVKTQLIVLVKISGIANW